MANYIFEQMTDGQAAAYDPSADSLYFLTGDPSTVGVTVNPASGLSLASLTLTNNGVTHTFGADALAGENLTFFGASSSDTLAFGADSTGTSHTVVGTAGAAARYFALGGGDTVTGSAANDAIYGGAGNDTINGVSDTQNSHGDYTESDFLNGGAGNDSIIGGNGNDHIYGNEQTSVAGGVDGDDTLHGGDGNDYIQGNAGNDDLTGDNGNDRVYGGAGDDFLSGGNGNDYLQGNKGADELDGGNGNDTVHGGANDDSVYGGLGNDQLFGDAGNDTLQGGGGFDTLTGGDGADHFLFGANDASIANLTTASTAADHDLVNVITDFTHGTDKLALTFAPAAAANVGTSATNFANIDDAYAFAQSQLTGHGSNVEVLQVGSDSVLFWDSAHTTGTIDSAVVLQGVTASTIDFHDFV